jgi:putative ABC transport system permease protein
MPHTPRWLLALFGLSLLAMPRQFRRRHAAAMVETFRRLAAEASAHRGILGVTSCLLYETFDVLRAGLRLRLAEFGARRSRRRSPPNQHPQPSVRMDNLRQDLLYALRAIRRRPGPAALAVLLLALGIGASTTVFSVVNNVLLQPLPYPAADRLVMVWRTLPQFGWRRAPVSYPNYQDWRDAATSFEAMGVYSGPTPMTLIGAGTPLRLQAQLASASLFEMLGARPALGRLFGEEDVQQAAKVAVLDPGLWQSRFGGDPGIIGRTVRLDGELFTVIGVMAEDFVSLGGEPDLWLPVSTGAAAADRGANFLLVLGRTRPGVTLDGAGREMEAIVARLAERYPDENLANSGVWLEPRLEAMVREARTILWVLFASVLIVLALACTNLAGLGLARAAARGREMAVRAALGAGRGRLVRQLLTENLLIALAGGTLGALLAFWLTRAFLALEPGALPRRGEVAVDPTTLAFALLISVACGLAVGLVPALRASRPDLQDELKQEGGRSTQSRSRHRLQQTLVGLQVAFAVVLLISAGLVANSFIRLLRVEPGFDPSNVLSAQIALPEARYDGPEEVRGFYERLLHDAAALPEVRSAGAAFSLPFSPTSASGVYTVEDQRTPKAEQLVYMTPVLGDYFRTMRIPFVEGQGFGGSARADGPRVAVINETMARRHWRGETAVGKRFKRGDPDSDNPWITVVGVVSDVKHRGLDDEPQSQAYLPLTQAAWPTSLYLTLRTEGDPLQVAAPLRALIQRLDPELPVTRLDTMSHLIGRSLAEPRFRTLLIGLFAAAAGLLAVIGIYGVLSFIVAGRTREIGVRIALGARSGQVMGLVFRQALVVVLAGTAVGTIAALVTTRALRSLLFEVQPTDPLTYAGVIALLVITSTIACWVPARRARRVDPMVALSNE